MGCDYQNVYAAWCTFRKGKKPSWTIDTFAYYLETNVLDLTEDIAYRRYIHGGYQRVVVEEKKRRDLAVAGVRDRVVHRLVYDRLVSLYDRRFDPDVWSCRAGKGLHHGLARLQQLLQRYPGSFVWRADITKFFDNVDHDVLRKCLRRTIAPGSTISYLCEQIIQSYAAQKLTPERGGRDTYWQSDEPSLC